VALLALAAVVAGGTDQSAVAAQPIPRPGAGLGDSTAAPLGTPVTLQLPPGYTLVEIRGGASDNYLACVSEDVPEDDPACALARGPYEVTLVLRLDPAAYRTGQDSNRGACQAGDAGTWSGWVLPSEGGAAQTIMVPIMSCRTADGGTTPILELPAPSAAQLSSSTPAVIGTSTSGLIEFTVGGYCLNVSRDIPDETHRYNAGVITRDPGLLRILAAIQGKDFNLYDSKDFIQEVIWDYTDGDGLTQAAINELMALP